MQGCSHCKTKIWKRHYMEPFQCLCFFLRFRTSGGFCGGDTTGLFAQQPGRGGLVRGGSDNDKSEQTKGGSREETACLPEVCDSCCWKPGRKLENERIQEAPGNRWIGTPGPAAGFPRGLTPAVTSPFIIVTLSYRGVRLWAMQLFPEAPAEPTACRCVMNEDGGALVPVRGSSSIAQKSRRLQIARGLECILYHTY